MDMQLEDITASGDGMWLARAACTVDEGEVETYSLDDFFVEAGHTISDEVLKLCQTCPVRVECLRYAYQRNISAGYFGGVSPGQRRTMSLDDALDFITSDTPEGR
jgi:hypothetical protein